MSAKNRAIGDTEDEFQAALTTYTKAGNKTAAMRRLWNAAYEMGKAVAETAAPAALAVEEVRAEPVKEKKSKRIEEAKKTGFAEGRQAGFEEGRQSALTADAFALSFAAGKTAGLASGMELGREAEEQRWEDSGHFTDAARFFQLAFRLDKPLRHITTTPRAISRRSDEIGTTTTTAILFGTNIHQYSTFLTAFDTPRPRSCSALEVHRRRTSIGAEYDGMDLDDGLRASAFTFGWVRVWRAAGNARCGSVRRRVSGGLVICSHVL
ncbi:hypothetical protein B0H13DRAFT_1882005 [Mycena leptocephala]|nr:hypothetical protein B0H13DRAFT_1882005 [Mycena leptocephala]